MKQPRGRVHLHPANQARHDQVPFGDRAADKVTNCMGSWKFLIIQTIVVAVWMTLNTIAWAQHWDTYPFILLNLAMSLQAAYASPLILLAQNRQTEHDRRRAEEDYSTNAEALTLLKALVAGQTAIRTSQEQTVGKRLSH